MPVTVVDRVTAGVEVDVATLPAKPLADTTDILVTVPPLAAPHVALPLLSLVRTLPLAIVPPVTCRLVVLRLLVVVLAVKFLFPAIV
jgi:hypothetical protein